MISNIILKNKAKSLFINPVFKVVKYKEDLNTQIEKYYRA